MYVEYEGQIFKARIIGDNIKIWKYIPVEGFKREDLGDGIIIYSKEVPKEEIKRYYSTSFVGVIEGNRFHMTGYYDNHITLSSMGTSYAIEHGFVEYERGLWEKYVELNILEEIWLDKTVKEDGKDTDTMEKLTIEEFKEAWRIYEFEVSPIACEEEFK